MGARARVAEYRRAQVDSEEWHELNEDGWRTITINTDGIALMIRAKRRSVDRDEEES